MASLGVRRSAVAKGARKIERFTARLDALGHSLEARMPVRLATAVGALERARLAHELAGREDRRHAVA